MTQVDKQNAIVTSGFPRSGNTFVNFAFAKLFNLEYVNLNRHAVVTIKNRNHTFVPFRNPIDCISSWHLYQDEFLKDIPLLENDLKFYLRFHNNLKNLLDKVTLLDFDLFKDDLSYLTTKVTNLYPIKPFDVTLEEVKTFMNKSGKSINLPRNTQEQKQEIQEWIKGTDLYQECASVYQSLKQGE
jgi:hypothetical protein